jgi:basic amino acid/polyamine antiporter, APA family
VTLPSAQKRPELVRAIGRWSMVALTLNSILGSGVFGLPAVLAGLLGNLSPLAVLLAGCGMAVIIACYAEVASQFSATGGTYLFVRHAFGALAGLEVAWLNLLSRLTACAASVNLFIAYLAQFWPQVSQPLPRLLIISAFIGTLAAINVRGVGAGVRLGNPAVVAKLAVLAGVCAAGVLYLTHHPAVRLHPVSPTSGDWLTAMLLLMFAYGGFETALSPMGEARDPRRDAGFALFTALAVLTVLYSLLQYLVMAALPDASHSERPLADAAQVFMGSAGAALVAVGALVSVYGYLSANLLAVPRALYALGEAGEFPAALAAVHPRFRTPYVAIVIFALLVWGFAWRAGFAWNVTLSAVARLIYYAAVCAAVPVLRRRQPGSALVKLPGGPVLPALGVLICATLCTRVNFSKSLIVLATLGVAAVNWLIVGARRRS